MHIGFLTPEYATPANPSGGLANYLKKTCSSLVKRGHEVSIILISNRNYVWKDKEIEIYEINAHPYFLSKIPKLKSIHFLSQIIASNQIAKNVWKIHKIKPFDILQASSYMAPGYKLLQNNEIPIVCRISSYTPLWQSAYGIKRSFIQYLANWIEIRQVRDADDAFAPSKLLADVYNHIEGCNVKVIRTPIDFEIEKEPDISFYDENFINMEYLLYFGQLSRIKGVDLLADVIPIILKKYENLHFVFIGRDDGTKEGIKVYDYIKTNCQEYSDRLHYYPPISKSCLVPVISNSIGVLMPSRADNYPNACLEALSLGIPVVGTYDSSLDEIVIDEKTGFLAENNSSQSLLEAIQKLLSQNSDEQVLIKENILEYIDSIKQEDRISQLINFYETVINKFNSKNSL